MDELSKRVLGLVRSMHADPEYVKLSKEYAELEDQFAVFTQSLTEEEQDMVWAFVNTSDAMNWRALEIICERYDIG